VLGSLSIEIPAPRAATTTFRYCSPAPAAQLQTLSPATIWPGKTRRRSRKARSASTSLATRPTCS